MCRYYRSYTFEPFMSNHSANQMLSKMKVLIDKNDTNGLQYFIDENKDKFISYKWKKYSDNTMMDLLVEYGMYLPKYMGYIEDNFHK